VIEAPETREAEGADGGGGERPRLASSRLVLLDLSLLSLMILASRLALVLHEGGGHALTARFLGARSIGIRLSPLGGGFVQADFPGGKPGSAGGVMLFALGGIAVNLLTGAAAWIWARRLRHRGLRYAALLFFGVGSVLGAITYLTCGIYYNSGDPVGLAPETEDLGPVQWMWLLFLAPAAAAAWTGMRHYLEFLSGLVDLSTPARRVGWMVATVAAAGLGYGGLWLAVRNPRIEGSTAQWRLEREIEKETARRRDARPAPVDRSPTPAVPPSPPPPIIVRPEEVAGRVPLPVGPIVLYGTILSSLFLSAARSHPSPGTTDVRAGPAALLVGLAAAAVGGFWLLG
jgi:hypothetical protein